MAVEHGTIDLACVHRWNRSGVGVVVMVVS